MKEHDADECSEPGNEQAEETEVKTAGSKTEFSVSAGKVSISGICSSNGVIGVIGTEVEEDLRRSCS